MNQNAKDEIFKAGPHLGIINLIKPLLAIVPILDLLKIPEAFCFFGIFRGYKMSNVTGTGTM